MTDEAGVLVGLVRGQALFERQAFDISAQAGSMVGVEKEERVATHWGRSFRFRHPWLQLNLLTAFLAAGVVGMFQSTVDRIVVLAAFLPVLAGQSENSGCQALAVTLRGLTLGDLKLISPVKLVLKEAGLGFLNGAIVGMIAGGGMWFYAHLHHTANPLLLGLIVWLAMTVSCVTQVLRRPRAADAQAAGSRPGDGFQHLPDDRHRRRQHGPVARPGHPARSLNVSRHWIRSTAFSSLVESRWVRDRTDQSRPSKRSRS